MAQWTNWLPISRGTPTLTWAQSSRQKPFGVHSRIDARVHDLCASLNVGNIYVNRNQIGAVVGSQPFGGEGLSGTGPKAGGPDYLKQFVQADVVTSVESVMPKLTTLGAQSLISELERPARLALHSETLPGPTGELNVLSTYAKGVVLCLGPNEDQAAKQASLVSASGCTPCILPDLDLTALSNLSGFEAVVLWGNEADARTARSELAKRDGALIALITGIDVTDRCILERHVCIDTTAAGGNVALLAAGG